MHAQSFAKTTWLEPGRGLLSRRRMEATKMVEKTVENRLAKEDLGLRRRVDPGKSK